MGEIRLPRHMFLWSMSVIYMFAFASFYVQIPGLYGNEGILPARWLVRDTDRPLVEQLQESPTLVWLAPHLRLDTQQAMELISLLGLLLAFGALVLEPLRDSFLFLCLWVLYFSLYQVGHVFVHFQWDNLLLETGFLTILVAPLNLFRWRSSLRLHDPITFWLLRWLLFRFIFASGVTKLTSRCPTWWGLTALRYHYETQCIPTPLAWYAHQLPGWFQKLSAVGIFVIEIAVPFLFFAPIRCLRLTAFYLQVLLQVFLILTGNYNFFNLLAIALCFSLLDDDHVGSWIGHKKKKKPKTWFQTTVYWAAFLVELAVYVLLIYWARLYFQLEINWETKTVSSKAAFTYDQFHRFLREVTVSSIWIGVLSLTWEVITAMFKCASVRGFWKLWVTIQWAVFASAAAAMFALSVVPYTTFEQTTHSNIWPGVRRFHEIVDRYHLVSSYGLFRPMTRAGGRPEVVIEGSMDAVSWTEINFMYKPGNETDCPPLVAPHHPRLEWQMWLAALDPHSQSPWFTSLVTRLLQGSRSVISLIQVDDSQYPFNQQPPVYVRAHLYKYWFTEGSSNGTYPQQWWSRMFAEEFFPIVHLGDPTLESLLSQYGLKEKDPVHLSPEGAVPEALRLLSGYVKVLSAPHLLWSLFSTGATICLVKTLCSTAPRVSGPKSAPTESKNKKVGPERREQARKRETPTLSQAEGGKPEERVPDSDRSPRKRK